MHKEKDDIGELFANKFEHFEMDASSQEWSDLKFRLAWFRFMRFNVSQFNIYYLTTAILVILFLIFRFHPDFHTPAEFTPVDKNQTHPNKTLTLPESVPEENELSKSGQQRKMPNPPVKSVPLPQNLKTDATLNPASAPADQMKQSLKPVTQDSISRSLPAKNDSASHKIKRVKKTILIQQQQVIVKDTVYIAK